jgi:hypothetical protein
MTEIDAPQLVKMAREVMGWDEQGWGDMFGVEAGEVRAWESGAQAVDELVALISDFVVRCQSRADLLHEIFDIPSLDENDVITLLTFLRDGIASPADSPGDLAESLQKAIDMVLELAVYKQDLAPEGDSDERWEV